MAPLLNQGLPAGAECPSRSRTYWRMGCSANRTSRSSVRREIRNPDHAASCSKSKSERGAMELAPHIGCCQKRSGCKNRRTCSPP